MNRLHSLDYLRGICSVLIMIYHYMTFSGLLTDLNPALFMVRVGLYGVSIFYILSGLTLFLVYNERFEIREFYIKRFFRIYPLLWIVITMTIILNHLTPTAYKIFINYTGIFGLISWSNYIGTGVWSIGNELCFYILFPVLMLCIKNKYSLAIACLSIFGFYIGFAFIKMDNSIPLADQWSTYTNPLNQCGLFLAGFLLGLLFKNRSIKQSVVIILFATSALAFIFYPVSGSTIDLVTKLNRIALTLTSLSLCFCFFKFNKQIPILHPILSLIGEASYSIYLVHPIVWLTFKLWFPEISPIPQIIICILLSVSVSYAIFIGYEKPFMKIGKRLSRHLTESQKK